MNCHRVQILLSSFIDQELDIDEKRELRKHLFACPECDSEYQELLRLKNFLENIAPEPFDFHPTVDLKHRLLAEENFFLPPVPKMVWFRRLSLIAACMAAYLLTTSMLFPSTQQMAPQLASRRPENITMTPVSSDESLSIDQSVSVYQASMILP